MLYCCRLVLLSTGRKGKSDFMKLLGVFALIFSLYATWGLFNGSEVGISEGVHIKIQENLQNELIEIITEYTPEASGVEVKKFWTKSLAKNKIRAFFEIAYTKVGGEEDVIVKKKGQTDLFLAKSDEETQYWEAETLTIDGQAFEFSEGLTFRPDNR